MSNNSGRSILSQSLIDGLRPDLQYQIALTNLLSKNQPTEVVQRLGDKVMQESFESKSAENQQETTLQSKPTEQSADKSAENTEKPTEQKPAENVEKPTQPKPQQTQPEYNPNTNREQTKNNEHTCSSKIIIVIIIVMFVMFLFMFYVSYQQRRIYKLFKKLVKEIS